MGPEGRGASPRSSRLGAQAGPGSALARLLRHHPQLPGENPGEYEAKLYGIFSALAPRDDAQAELVALVADYLWKLGRMARIEKGITLGRIEELLALTGTAEKAGATVNAINAVGRALTSWMAEPVPSSTAPPSTRWC